MRRRAGITLIELLAVILAVAVIVMAVMFIVGRSPDGPFRELARRASCKANISAIGKGLVIYTAANRDKWPWLVSDSRWDAATGESQQVEPSEKTNYNVSALLFLLVREESAYSGVFVCPSTADTPDPNSKSDARPLPEPGGGRPLGMSTYNWDFSPYKVGRAEHLSYSYQAPLVKGNETPKPKPQRQSRRSPGRQTAITPAVPEPLLRSGVDGNSELGLAVLGDRTPEYAGLKPDFNWPNPGMSDPNAGMSQNHTRGEMINLLYADLHVGDSIGRADIGINNDNIYSAAGLGADGNTLRTNQGPGSLKITDHRSPRDSFLVGPKRMEK